MKPRQSSGGDFQLVNVGVHFAVCYAIIDLGVQKSEWQGVTSHKAKIYLGWEICDEKMEDGRPLVVGKRYTNSIHAKSQLYADVTSWLGKAPDGDFDYKQLLGAPCLLNILHETKDSRIYARISAITPLMPGMNPPPLVNEKVMLSLDLKEFDVGVFGRLSQGLQKTIKESPDYKALEAAGCFDGNPQTQTHYAPTDNQDCGHAGLDIPISAYDDGGR